MQSVTLIAFFIAHVHTNKPASNDINDSQADQLEDKVLNRVDKLIDRLLQAAPIYQADLDATVLRKPANLGIYPKTSSPSVSTSCLCPQSNEEELQDDEEELEDNDLPEDDISQSLINPRTLQLVGGAEAEVVTFGDQGQISTKKKKGRPKADEMFPHKKKEWAIKHLSTRREKMRVGVGRGKVAAGAQKLCDKGWRPWTKFLPKKQESSAKRKYKPVYPWKQVRRFGPNR